MIQLPREYWTWADEANAHQALTDPDTWEKAQAAGREHGNSMDPGTRHLGRTSGRLYPYRSKVFCNQCHRRMHGTQSATRRAGYKLVYYVCPTLLHKPEDKAKWPGHIRASIREDVLTTALSAFLDQYAFGYDRAAQLAGLIPVTQAQQDDNDQARIKALNRQLKKTRTALEGTSQEIGLLLGRDDPAGKAIRERLYQQFSNHYEQQARLEAELQAITDAPALTGTDLALIDELPHAIGLLDRAPDDLREQLAAAFTLHAVYRPDTRQATVALTITDTTPATINAIAADPRINHNPATPSPATSQNTSADVSRSPMRYKTLRDHGIAVSGLEGSTQTPQ